MLHKCRVRERSVRNILFVGFTRWGVSSLMGPPSLVCFPPPPPPPISRHRGPSLFSPFPFSTIRVLLLGVPCLFMQTLGSGRNGGRRCERARRGERGERRVLSYFLPFLRTVGDKMEECGGGFAQFFVSKGRKFWWIPEKNEKIWGLSADAEGLSPFTSSGLFSKLPFPPLRAEAQEEELESGENALGSSSFFCV